MRYLRGPLGISGASWVVAALFVLSGCAGTGSEAAPNSDTKAPTSATETAVEEATPEQVDSPEDESDVAPQPALQSKPPAFEAQMDKVLGALDARGYDTTTGEIGSANAESRVLAPIAANSDLPVVLLLLEWGTSEPFGDGTTTGSRELPNFTLSEIGDGEVWFFCGEMIVRLRADLSEQEFDALASGLYSESC